MRMKMMKKNKKFKKLIRKYDRRFYLSSKNMLNYVLITMFGNLWFFESKKSNIYFSKLIVFFKVFLRLYTYTNVLSTIDYNHLNLNPNFHKTSTSKDLSIQSFHIQNKFYYYDISLFESIWTVAVDADLDLLNFNNSIVDNNNVQFSNIKYEIYNEYLFTYSYVTNNN